MISNTLIEWALAIVGSGGLGAALMYLFTFKSQTRKAAAQAEEASISAEHKKLDLRQDQYEFLQKTCDKYIKDYHELEGDFRKQIQQLRARMDDIMMEKSQAISTKCNEIAALKSEVTYLKGIRCYNFTCQNRIIKNPDKVKE